MRIKIIYLCLLTAFSFTSCSSTSYLGKEQSVKGDKNIVTRTIQVKDFQKIYLGSNIEPTKGINPFNKKNHAICNYTQKEGSSTLEITMDENLFDLLDIEDNNQQLVIQAKSGMKIRPTEMSIKVSSADLKTVEINGSVNFLVDKPLELANTSFQVNGVSEVNIADISCDTFRVYLSGVGNIYLNGNIKDGIYSASGIGHVYAFDCPVETLACDVSGIGGMEVNATQALNASTSGIGSIKYKGNPKDLQKSAAGIGKIKQAD